MKTATEIKRELVICEEQLEQYELRGYDNNIRLAVAIMLTEKIATLKWVLGEENGKE